MTQWKKIGLQQCDCRARDACRETSRASGLWTRYFPKAALLKSISLKSF